MQIDAEFRELYDQLSSATDINEYIDFDIEAVTFFLAIDPLMVEGRKETRKKTITEGIEMSDAAVEEANQSEKEPKVVPDEAEYIER